MGKTILTANLAGFLVDAGQHCLLEDGDTQPNLSSYFPPQQQADGGLHQPITTRLIHGTISITGIPRLDIVMSDAPEGSIKNWILYTPDGRVYMLYDLQRPAMIDGAATERVRSAS